jgi:purine-nucleoside phosphorylase
MAKKLSHSYEDAARLASSLLPQCPMPLRVALVLGSGLNVAAELCPQAKRVPYPQLPNFPRPTVSGHSGILHLGTVKDVPVAILEGRSHFYEGCSGEELVFPVRVMALLGVRTIVFTCAAGGIAPEAQVGSFVMIQDHLNFQGVHPLAGPHDPRWGERFVDLSVAYDPALRRLAQQSAKAAGARCSEGIYAAMLGPSYETPAEIRMLKQLGADVVGMSTVPEVIAARQAGLRVLALATVTNRAAGLEKTILSHAEVLKAGKHAAEKFTAILRNLLPKLHTNRP